MRMSKNPTKSAPTKSVSKSVSKKPSLPRTGSLRVWLFLILDYLGQHFSRVNRFILGTLTVLMCIWGGFVVNFSVPKQPLNTKIDIAKFTTQSNTDDPTANVEADAGPVDSGPVIAIDSDVSVGQA